MASEVCEQRTKVVASAHILYRREMGGRYPKHEAMFRSALDASCERFAELREDFLLDYGYNTARAYWADLDDILRWAVRRKKDPLALTEQDMSKYLALLRKRGYSESTIRRRLTAWRGIEAHRNL